MSKEKVITFSKEEKSLIYNRFVAPANGTKEEALHFVEYCETLGLNPLLGDVVFQKFESKYGPKTTFVTTRDGLMRVAVRDDNYVGPPISNVVREGDHFEYLPAEGTVIHKFGQKRGRILGAYAVLYHRQYRPYACWADFAEYFQANAKSQNGKSYIWDCYPSAMIEKVAEAFALKRQFPIVGGLTTEEEIGLDDHVALGQQPPSLEETPASESTGKDQTHAAAINDQTEDLSGAGKVTDGKSDVLPTQESVLYKSPAGVRSADNTKHRNEEKPPSGREVQIEQVEIGTSHSGIPFGKVFILTDSGQKLLVLAKGKEQVALTKSLNEGERVNMEIVEENGFHFLKGVQSIA